jgi:hypothetical protein
MDKTPDMANWTTARVTRETFNQAERLRKDSGLRSVSSAVTQAIRFIQDPANEQIHNAFLNYVNVASERQS